MTTPDDLTPPEGAISQHVTADQFIAANLGSMPPQREDLAQIGHKLILLGEKVDGLAEAMGLQTAEMARQGDAQSGWSQALVRVTWVLVVVVAVQALAMIVELF